MMNENAEEEINKVASSVNDLRIENLRMQLTQQESVSERLQDRHSNVYYQLYYLNSQLSNLQNACYYLKEDFTNAKMHSKEFENRVIMLSGAKDRALDAVNSLKDYISKTEHKDIDKYMEKAFDEMQLMMQSIKRCSIIDPKMIPKELEKCITLEEGKVKLEQSPQVLHGEPNEQSLDNLEEKYVKLDELYTDLTATICNLSEELHNLSSCVEEQSLNKPLLECELEKIKTITLKLDEFGGNVLSLDKRITDSNFKLAKLNESKSQNENQNSPIHTNSKRQKKMSYRHENLVSENVTLQKEMEQLKQERTFLSERHESAVKEIKSLKLQLDEYENDIQQHLNLEKQNLDLQVEIQEIQSEKCKFAEDYLDKCRELSIFFEDVNSIIESIRQGETSVYLLDNDGKETPVLSKLCSEISNRFSDFKSRLANLESKLEISKQVGYHLKCELDKIKDLKQFLEDEVAELKEENRESRATIKIPILLDISVQTDEILSQASVSMKDEQTQIIESDQLVYKKELNANLNSDFCVIQNEINSMLAFISKLKKSFPCDINISSEETEGEIFSTANTISHMKDNIISSINRVKDEYKSLTDVLIQQVTQSSDKAEPEKNCISCKAFQKRLSDEEIKMTQFKVVAAKWRKQMVKSEENFNNLSKEEMRLKSELENLSAMNQKYLQNFQTLQVENDRLQDENENLNSMNNSLKNNSESSRFELDQNRTRVEELEGDKRKIEIYASGADLEISRLKEKIADLESKVIVFKTKKSGAEGKIKELQRDLEKLGLTISDLTKEKEGLQKKLNTELTEKKQHSLLDLEMADYERTISELTESISKKDAEIRDIKEDLDGKISQIKTCEENMKFCESHRKTEEERANDFKVALEECKQELVHFKEKESCMKDEIAEFLSKLELKETQIEQQTIMLSKACTKIEVMKKEMQETKENNEQVVHSLISKIKLLEQQFATANKAQECIKNEFDSYKTRVHSVLKQQKSISPIDSIDLEMKKKLETDNDKLKLQVKNLSDKLSTMNTEHAVHQEEHDNLVQRHYKVVEELENKDQEWSHRLEESEYEKKQLLLQINNIYSEHSLKREILTASYKKQVQSMQHDHQLVIEELQRKLEAANSEIGKLLSETKSTSSASPNENSKSDTFQEHKEEESEITSSRKMPIRHLSLATIPTSGFMPLEKLLESPSEPLSPTSTISNHDSEKMTLELSSLQKKIDHLSELLNESEANNHRGSEQVRVLKEEVRRLERNKERNFDAENLEYLKNVVLKFSTLECGNEKASLVPVLHTLLKLSPDEQKNLKEVAGGDQGTGETWSSYLHRWSGLS